MPKYIEERGALASDFDETECQLKCGVLLERSLPRRAASEREKELRCERERARTNGYFACEMYLQDTPERDQYVRLTCVRRRREFVRKMLNKRTILILIPIVTAS